MVIHKFAQVNNCTDCPMANNTGSKYSTFYGCNVSDEGMTVFHDSEVDETELPRPTDCPLNGGPFLIKLID